jgi:hypothetical protein
MRLRLARWLVLTLVLTATPSLASASVITGNLTADDTFSVYISPDDTLLGVLICNDPDTFWGTVASCGPAALTPGVTNYLHVVASDLFGSPSMFIGTFTLGDTLFEFSNGSQTLSTNAADWVVRLTGFGDADQTPAEIGPNGTAPWGFFPTIAADAQFIWDVPGGCDRCTRYFSAAITPTDTTAVPEPAILTLVGLGLVGSARRFRSRHTTS